jgi:hypothetical protein
MNHAVLIEESVRQFKQSLQEIAEEHGGKELCPETLAELTGSLWEASLGAARNFLQGHLHANDPKDATIRRDGKLLRRKDDSGREVLTWLGPVRIERSLYQADHGGPAFFPLDELCGFHGLYATREVREACLFHLAFMTPKNVEAALRKSAPFQPSAGAIRSMGLEAGMILDLRDEELFDQVRNGEAAPEGTEILAVSLDGANVLLNEKGTQKGRPAERPGVEASGASAWRNAMVGSISFHKFGEGEDGRPERLASRYVAQMPEPSFPKFRARFEAEVAHAKKAVGEDAIRVLVCDGARSLWKYAENNPLFRDFEKILDFYHAAEHLSKAAEAIFGKTSPESAKWYNRWRRKLLEIDNAPEALVRSMDRYAKRDMGKTRREELAAQRTFFARNAKRMRYADFRRRGLPIGSGVVEAACKTIVKERLCQSGMRWSRTGGQAILNLRAAVKSGRWDRFWKILAEAQEQHQIPYRDT